MRVLALSLLILFSLIPPGSTFSIFGFGSPDPAVSAQPVNRSNRPPPPPKKSENSWLYDLLYGKKPQYYEPQPVQYQPQEQYNEYNQFQEREQDYQDYQYQQQQPIQQQSQTPSTTTARTTTRPTSIRIERISASVQKPVEPHSSGFQDYQDIEIITAPPPDRKKGFGQSFEVKVGAGFGTKN